MSLILIFFTNQHTSYLIKLPYFIYLGLSMRQYLCSNNNRKINCGKLYSMHIKYTMPIVLLLLFQETIIISV